MSGQTKLYIPQHWFMVMEESSTIGSAVTLACRLYDSSFPWREELAAVWECYYRDYFKARLREALMDEGLPFVITPFDSAGYRADIMKMIKQVVDEAEEDGIYIGGPVPGQDAQGFARLGEVL